MEKLLSVQEAADAPDVTPSITGRWCLHGLHQQSRFSTRKSIDREQPLRIRSFYRAETFVLECGGLRYTCTVGRFPDGRLAEVFLSNHKSNSAADANARDAAIVCSIALQCGADIETIRRALSRDSRGHTTGPLGVALDLICGEGER